MANLYRTKGERVKAQIVDFNAISAIIAFLQERKVAFELKVVSENGERPRVYVSFVSPLPEGSVTLHANPADMIVLKDDRLSVWKQDVFYREYEVIR
ncbi:hypothetical protein FHV99_004655 [Ochrobactrum sp. P20RRXII]|nr:hypothetical protein [Ochrobactrum sp. P20RRXII]NIH77403.1 hypothetical protein [Ochrobactrum sp. P20RRXII]